MISFPFHVHAILKLTPFLSQKSENKHLVYPFCSSTTKRSTVTPIFSFIVMEEI